MEDLLKNYQTKAAKSGDFHQRNRHKHSTEPATQNSDDTYVPKSCHYALGNNFD